VRSQPKWDPIYWSRRPIFNGRGRRGGIYGAVSAAFSLPARLPLLEELFLGRICCVLVKRD
jgi:hypothetical protein